LVEERLLLLVSRLGLHVTDLFKPEQELLTRFVKRESALQLSLTNEKSAIKDFYSALKATAGAVDITLQQHTEALEKLALRKIEALEKKMLRAEKKKFEAQLRQIHKLKSQLFPHNNLQERIENLMPFYAKWGKGFIKAIYDHSGALEQEFVLLEAQ